LVLINGLFATLDSYDEFCTYLTNDFNILRYDCRGQGKSEKPVDGYSLNDHVDDLKQVLEENNITSKIFIIGLSNGGRIALEYSLQNPQNINAIAACDTYAEVTPMIKLKLQSWLTAYEIGGATHRFDVATPWVWGESLVNSKPELIEYYREDCDAFPAHVVNGLINGAQDSNINLEMLKVPTLYLVGNEDLLTPKFLHQEMLEKSLKCSPLSELIEIQGGHASILESCKEGSAQIKTFFKRFL
jgi:3-oxoadipate enol-lactonase